MTKIIDIKSMLIGFLLATSVMLFMGATTDNANGRYQMTNDLKMIDTRTGELYVYKTFKEHWKKETKDENWIVR